jgi:hypothetical protein
LKRFPERIDFDYGAHFGLSAVQNYYDLDFANFTAGIMRNPETGQEFLSLHSLSPEDCQGVGRAAGEAWRLDKMAQWYGAAVDRNSIHCGIYYHLRIHNSSKKKQKWFVRSYLENPEPKIHTFLKHRKYNAFLQISMTCSNLDKRD